MKKIVTGAICAFLFAFTSQTFAASDDAFKQAVKPCVIKINEAIHGNGGDPSQQELNKCIDDLLKAEPDWPSRELAAVMIGYTAAKTPYKQETAATEDNSKVLTISATKLVDAFKANELKANNQYKGKEMIVTGTVHQISVNFGVVSVDIKGEKYGFQNVKALVTKDQEAKAAELTKGQKVKIKGVCDGLSFMDVALKDAVIL